MDSKQSGTKASAVQSPAWRAGLEALLPFHSSTSNTGRTNAAAPAPAPGAVAGGAPGARHASSRHHQSLFDLGSLSDGDDLNDPAVIVMSHVDDHSRSSAVVLVDDDDVAVVGVPIMVSSAHDLTPSFERATQDNSSSSAATATTGTATVLSDELNTSTSIKILRRTHTSTTPSLVVTSADHPTTEEGDNDNNSAASSPSGGAASGPSSSSASSVSTPSASSASSSKGNKARPTTRPKDSLLERLGKSNRIYSPAFEEGAVSRDFSRGGPGGDFSDNDLASHQHSVELSAWAALARRERAELKGEQQERDRKLIEFSKWKGENVMEALDETDQLFRSRYGHVMKDAPFRAGESSIGSSGSRVGPTIAAGGLSGSGRQKPALEAPSSGPLFPVQLQSAVLADIERLRVHVDELCAALEREREYQELRFKRQHMHELEQSRIWAAEAQAYTPDAMKSHSHPLDLNRSQNFAVRGGGAGTRNVPAIELSVHGSGGVVPGSLNSSMEIRPGHRRRRSNSPFFSRTLFEEVQHHQQLLNDSNFSTSETDDDSDAYLSAEDDYDYPHGVVSVADVLPQDTSPYTPGEANSRYFQGLASAAAGGVRRALGF